MRKVIWGYGLILALAVLTASGCTDEISPSLPERTYTAYERMNAEHCVTLSHDVERAIQKRQSYMGGLQLTVLPYTDRNALFLAEFRRDIVKSELGSRYDVDIPGAVGGIIDLETCNIRFGRVANGQFIESP